MKDEYPWTGLGDAYFPWACYARLSKLKPNRKRGRQRTPDESVQRQVALIRAHAAERGLDLPEHFIYIENGRSAWQKPGGPPPRRPVWDQMLAAGKARMFGGLLTWKVDRFTRSPRDGEDLADLCLVLDGPECARMDLRTAAGLSEFRREVESSARYSHEISEKIRGAFADMLAHGYRIGGSGRLFGLEILSEAEIDWDWDSDPDARITGPAAVYREAEAEVVRQWAAMLLAGEKSEAMCAYANERGFITPRGHKWDARSIIRTLGNPVYGGRLVHKGEEVGRLANVEPILDEQTYLDVQAKLGARRLGRRPVGMHLLTGSLHCGNPECQRRGTMTGFIRHETGRRYYICHRPGTPRGCGMEVAAAPVEARVRDEVIAGANDPDLQADMAGADAVLDEERAALADLLDALDRDIAATEAKAAKVPYNMTRTRTQYERNVATMLARFEEADRKLKELGDASRRVPRVPPLTAEEWDNDLTPAERAEYIRRLGLRVTILPSKYPRGASRRPFEDWRVVITEVEPKTHP
jgi:DNA invertase Pin-like site-specific DNA recombinase